MKESTIISWTSYSQCPELLHFSLGFPLDKSSLSGHSWDSNLKKKDIWFISLGSPEGNTEKQYKRIIFLISYLYLRLLNIFHIIPGSATFSQTLACHLFPQYFSFMLINNIQNQQNSFTSFPGLRANFYTK